MVHTHRDEGFAYWPRCEEFGGVKTKHKAFNPILEKIDLLKAQIEKKKEVRKVKIFKKFKLKEPYWFLNKEVIKIGRDNGYNLLHVIKIWIKTQFYYYKQLHFRKCGDSIHSHFLDQNAYCLRCKKSLAEIDRERHVKKVNDLIFSQADIDRAYNNSNAQGLQEYIEFLKGDISESTGIPTEVLFGSNQEETPPTITYNGRECRIVDYKIGVDRAIDNGVVVIYTLEDIETQERYEVVGDGRLEMFQILHSSSTGDPSSYLSTKIQLNKKDIDCWKDKRLSLLQRLYKKLFPIRWEVKEKVKAYWLRKYMKEVVSEVDRFIAYGDTLQPIPPERLRELAENRVNRVNIEGGIIPHLSPIIEGRRLVTEEQHLLEEGLRREMEEQMRQAALQNGMIPRSHGREHNPEWYSEMMQNPQPTPEPQNYGTLEGYAQREGDLPDLRVDTVNRINEALREASTIISGIIGNRVGDMYNGRDDMYSERLERLCYTMVNRMITPNFTLNSIEYINRNERDFLESIRFSQRIVRDGSYEYENFQRVKPTIYQARLGDIIYLPKVLNIELRKGNLVVQNINGELVRTLIENDAIGVVEEPSFMTQDSDYRLVRIKMLKGVNVIIKNGTLVKKVKFKPKPKPKEFKVSDLITLRLEPTDRWNRNNYETRAKTQIYIKGKKFRQCKFLLLNLEVGNSYEEIESIDQAAELLEIKEEDLIDLDTLTDTMDDLKPNYDGQLEIPHRTKITIPPETEFWGHCSNLEVWVLYDYDLRVLHSNLSLPLLKELAQYDDHAKLRLKEQIAEKVEKGGYKAWKTHRGIINRHFNKEEREMLEKFIEKPKPKRPFVDLINEALDEFVSRDGMVYTPITIISTEKIRNMIPTNEAIIVMDFPEIEHWICPSDAIENTITLRDNEDKVFKIDISNLKIPKNLIKSRGIDISLDDLEEELDLEADTTEMRWDGDTTEAPSR